MKSREEQLLERLRQAALALRTTLDERDELRKERSEPIAIVGIGCRLPGGASSPQAFWDLLAAGRDAVVPLETRWEQLGVKPDESLPRWAALLTEPLDEFEPQFFGISPREARSMDPQQRLMLEVAWESLEDAGIAPNALKDSRTGVFVAACTDDYSTLVESQPATEKDAYCTTGSMLSILAGRLSYTLGLQGPCFTVDTACSSSLVAIHQACRSLRSRESDLALSGGVNLIVSLDSTTGLSRIQALSPDGRCRTFDALANGYVRGEGCGLLVLKRLSDAVRDGDRIWAVIRGSAINQDGRSTGLTAPNVLAQQSLIRQALHDGGVDAASVGYVETHGTGTSLGDPIEVQALREVLGMPRADGTHCWLGALKTNIGHLEGAAGVAGVIKAALVLAMEKIPKNLHLRTLNAHIELDGSALKLANEAVAWPRGSTPRFAGVSGFGLSGTNVHVVLEEAPNPPVPRASANHPAAVVVLSGRTEGALWAQAARLAQHLQQHPDLSLQDVAYGLATTRSALDQRIALVPGHREALLLQLTSAAQGQVPAGAIRGTASSGRKLAFLCTGQGAQLPGMGRGLYEVWPAFRHALDRCFALFDPLLPRPLREVMWAEPGSVEARLLDQTGYTQPALFALEYALCELWRSFGVQPDFIAGHSIGELVAACIVGVFSLQDAVRLCWARAQGMQELPTGGAMLSVQISEAEAQVAIAAHRHAVSIAAVNADDQVVLSGDQATVSQLAAEFAERGIRTKTLVVSHAFHSAHMDAMLAPFRNIAQSVRYARPQLPLFSSTTGKLVTNEVCHAEYWVEQVRNTVRFAATINALQTTGVRTFLEIGPKATLLSLVPQHPERSASLAPSLRGTQQEQESVLAAVGALWTVGHVVDWSQVFVEKGNRISLPTYPWQRQRCWVTAPHPQSEPASTAHSSGRPHRSGHPLLGEAQRLSTQPDTRLWDTCLQRQLPAWIGDHQLKGVVVFPGAGHLEMALSAGVEVFGLVPFSVENLTLIEALVLPDETPLPVQAEVVPDRPGRMRFQVASRQLLGDKTTFRVHSRAFLARHERETPAAPIDLQAVRTRLSEGLPTSSLYAAMRSMGVELGPSFQGLRQLWQAPGEALGRVDLPEAAGSPLGYQFHPALLDACFQVMAACFGNESDHTPWVPVQLARLHFWQRPQGELYCHVRTVPDTTTDRVRRCANLCIADATGLVVAELQGLWVQRLASPDQVAQGESMLNVRWESKPRPIAKSTEGRWLLLGGEQTLVESLHTALLQAGQAVESVTQIPSKIDSWSELLHTTFHGHAPTAVVHLASTEEPAFAAGERPLTHSLRWCSSLLHTVQALVAMAYRDAPRLWLLTRGAQAVSVEPVAVQQAPILGMGRTIALEHPELRCIQLDLDPRQRPEEIETLLAELLADDTEDEVALRDGQRRVARIGRRATEWTTPEKTEPASGRPFRLDLDAVGDLDRLRLRATTRRPPSAGEVEIAVEAAGLNFRDVLLALGVIPSDQSEDANPLQLGSECAGRIVAVGSGVSGLSVGDAVLAIAPGTFASHLTCSAERVLPMLRGHSFAQAVAVPVAFLTAYYALAKLAQLVPGERVLIHSASGAVGLAAIQWAQHVGATVYATAGTPEKRAFLQSLGVAYVSDSRSDQFADDIRRWTSGEGVDVVLNSLSGELIQQSLDLLRDQGRFIELGKRDYFQNKQLAMRPFLRNLSFSLLDLDGLLRKRPAAMRVALAEIWEHFARGIFSVPPITEFRMDQATNAFRTMAQARHIGKLVLTNHAEDLRIAVPMAKPVQIRSDSSYLITGGLGGLGLHVAQWLCEQGAGQVVLMSRTTHPTAKQRASVEQMNQTGCRVQVVSCDVAERAGVNGALQDISDSGLPLRGVIHAAGELDDGVLRKLTPERFERVMHAKIDGAWVLHELTQATPLDFFVMYSSAAGLLGSPGQANYAAANTFLDALAHHRKALGLPGLSIDWGVFADVGMAADKDGQVQRLTLRGMRSLKPEEGLHILQLLLSSNDAQVGVVPINLRQWSAFHQSVATSARLSALRTSQHESSVRDGDPALLASLRAAPLEKRAVLLAEQMRVQVAHVLRTAKEQIDPSTPLTSLGLDSLMGLELRNHIESAFGLRVPVTILWTYPTLAALSEHLAGQLFPAESVCAPHPVQEAAGVVPSDTASVPMDDSELLAMLDDELALAKKPGA